LRCVATQLYQPHGSSPISTPVGESSSELLLSLLLLLSSSSSGTSSARKTSRNRHATNQACLMRRTEPSLSARFLDKPNKERFAPFVVDKAKQTGGPFNQEESRGEWFYPKCLLYYKQDGVEIFITLLVHHWKRSWTLLQQEPTLFECPGIPCFVKQCSLGIVCHVMISAPENKLITRSTAFS
jgi:hypothetical protein